MPSVIPPWYPDPPDRRVHKAYKEHKAPFFKAVELFPGEQIDLYLIPTAAGTYESICTITGHTEAGMHGHIVVAPQDQYLSNAGDFVSAADWDSMVTVTVEMSEYSFTPQSLTFVAGTPYKLEIKNVGDSKHYFTAEAFYRSIALRKSQTSEGEFKAPYMKAIEVFPGDQVDVYFVAVLTGTYGSVCPIPGHNEAGMTGSITVTGSTPSYPVPSLADVSDGDWVQNAGDLVSAADWDSMIDVTIELDEYSFSPSTVELKVDQPYRLQVINNGDVKHYFTAEDFYKTAAFRKARDSSGELKAPYFKAIELFPGEQIDLYLIPTVAGTYDSICTITGHADAGMTGSIVVTP